MILDPSIVVYHDHPFKSVRGSFLRAAGYSLNHVIVMRSFYGRLVCGSGSPAMVSLGSLIRESLGINAVRTYLELYPEAVRRNIKVSLIQFVIIRFLGSKIIPQAIGIMRGSIIRHVSYSDVPDLHQKIEKLVSVAPLTN